MILKILFTFIVFCTISVPASGQILIKGTIKDKTTGHVIPYANIGIVKKDIGTLSDEEGNFSLSIPAKFLNDTLTFSHVVYMSNSIPIIELKDKITMISLEEQPLTLNEVTVSNKKFKIRKRGNTSHNPVLYGMIESQETNDILEFGQLIELKEEYSFLSSAHLYLNAAQGLDSALIRINFYNVTAEGFPGERIVFKEIMTFISIEEGWLEFDLQPYNIALEQDFFITYEFIINEDPKKFYIYFGGKLFGRNGFRRTSSQGKWKELSPGSVSTYVKVEQ